MEILLSICPHLTRKKVTDIDVFIIDYTSYT
jgi:hypothetical protein